ncbi:hypothetical protein RD055328_10880 [Companilactobacillus sp. RD055328]|uniref:serine hydrolase n=1 Tax=Companilactobacillus sp. RD055328 TaxID=2916634 RepID=UPI001FC8D344|nr:serine hydrolase [Companilactobacillus sp. RD055328]GKQ43165.1 hypothetical protein RD055328_10880 [Companilactobacillus sp. RD055328]
MKKKTRFLILLSILVVFLLGTIKLSHGKTNQGSNIFAKSDVDANKLEKLNKVLNSEVKKYKSTNINISVKYKGKTITVTNNETAVYPTASVVKVSIAVQILHTYGSPNELSDTAKNNMALMMEQSDNNAATWLLTEGLGSKSALKSVFNSLDMTNSVINSTYWGLTTIPANDQIKVLDAVFNKDNSYLNSQSQEYLQNLMNNVEDEQNWGISKGSESNNVYVKNGWLNVDSSYDPNQGSKNRQTWIINSIGHIEASDGNDYNVAIMTNNNDTEESGIALVEHFGKKIHNILK